MGLADGVGWVSQPGCEDPGPVEARGTQGSASPKHPERLRLRRVSRNRARRDRSRSRDHAVGARGGREARAPGRHQLAAGKQRGMGEVGGLFGAVSVRVLAWEGWSNSGVWESRARVCVCVCARSRQLVCICRASGWIGTWGVWLKFGVVVLETRGRGGGSVAIFLWL